MASPRKLKITPGQAIQSIYIDFEGFGKSPQEACPLPHMLGVYRPKHGQIKATYEAYLFRESWRPVSNGISGHAKVSTLHRALHEILTEAENSDGRVVHFSQHEEAVVGKHCPDLYDRFVMTGFNVKPPLDDMFSKSRPGSKEKMPHKLVEYMASYFPAFDMPELPGGAADTCRYIDKAAEREKRWRRWSDADKARVGNLLDYNYRDCKATWKLTKKLANFLAQYPN